MTPQPPAMDPQVRKNSGKIVALKCLGKQMLLPGSLLAPPLESFSPERAASMRDGIYEQIMAQRLSGISLPAVRLATNPGHMACAGGAEAPGVSGRLLIDCMGNFSPIVRQARWGQRPDGVCLVVGSCCRGFTDNSTGKP